MADLLLGVLGDVGDVHEGGHVRHLGHGRAQLVSKSGRAAACTQRHARSGGERQNSPASRASVASASPRRMQSSGLGSAGPPGKAVQQGACADSAAHATGRHLRRALGSSPGMSLMLAEGAVHGLSMHRGQGPGKPWLPSFRQRAMSVDCGRC